MKEEKKIRLNLLKEKNKEWHKINPKLKLLEDKVLSLGGDIVVLMNEENEEIDKIMNRAKVIQSKGSLLKKGQPNRCHSNSGSLWENNKDTIDIVTGYALSLDEDGLYVWRCHTWCVIKESGKVIETTVKRKLYFGYSLTVEESEKFVWDNY